MKRLLYLVPLLFFACNSGSSESVLSKEQLLDSLNFTFDKLQGDLDAVEIVSYSEEQLQFAEDLLANYPQAAELDKWLFEGGKAGRTSGEYERGIKLFDAYLSGGYQEKAAEALFLKGFIYDEDLKAKEKAEGCYKELLEKYPNHELADDAQALLDQLYMTDQQIIDMLMQKNADSIQ